MAKISKLRLGNINTETYAIFQALKHPKTPIVAKLVGLLTLVYLFVPFDIITDVIPIIGWADDFVICFFLTKTAGSMVPAEIMAESRIIAQKRGKSIRNILFAIIGLMVIISITLMFILIRLMAEIF